MEEGELNGLLDSWENMRQFHLSPQLIHMGMTVVRALVQGQCFGRLRNFVDALSPGEYAVLRGNQLFLKSLLQLYRHEGRHRDVIMMIKNGTFQDPSGLLELWDHSHYCLRQIEKGKPLTSLERYRVRMRHPPPPSICSKGRRLCTRPSSWAVDKLRSWFEQHKTRPYPTREEKEKLAAVSRLSSKQVDTWFANARRRLRKELESIGQQTSFPRSAPKHQLSCTKSQKSTKSRSSKLGRKSRDLKTETVESFCMTDENNRLARNTSSCHEGKEITSVHDSRLTVDLGPISDSDGASCHNRSHSESNGNLTDAKGRNTNKQETVNCNISETCAIQQKVKRPTKIINAENIKADYRNGENIHKKMPGSCYEENACTEGSSRMGSRSDRLARGDIRFVEVLDLSASQTASLPSSSSSYTAKSSAHKSLSGTQPCKNRNAASTNNKSLRKEPAKRRNRGLTSECLRISPGHVRTDNLRTKTTTTTAITEEVKSMQNQLSHGRVAMLKTSPRNTLHYTAPDPRDPWDPQLPSNSIQALLNICRSVSAQAISPQTSVPENWCRASDEITPEEFYPPNVCVVKSPGGSATFLRSARERNGETTSHCCYGLCSPSPISSQSSFDQKRRSPLSTDVLHFLSPVHCFLNNMSAASTVVPAITTLNTLPSDTSLPLATNTQFLSNPSVSPEMTFSTHKPDVPCRKLLGYSKPLEVVHAAADLNMESSTQANASFSSEKVSQEPPYPFRPWDITENVNRPKQVKTDSSTLGKHVSNIPPTCNSPTASSPAYSRQLASTLTTHFGIQWHAHPLQHSDYQSRSLMGTFQPVYIPADLRSSPCNVQGYAMYQHQQNL